MGFVVVQVGAATVRPSAAQVVAGAVEHVLAVSGLLQHFPSRPVHFPAGGAAAGGVGCGYYRNGPIAGGGHHRKGGPHGVAGLPGGHPGDVGVDLAGLARPQVEEHHVARLQGGCAGGRGRVVGPGGVRAEGHDGRVVVLYAPLGKDPQHRLLHFQLGRGSVRQAALDESQRGVARFVQHRRRPPVGGQVGRAPGLEAQQQLGGADGLYSQSPQAFDEAGVHPREVGNAGSGLVVEGDAAHPRQQLLQAGVELLPAGIEDPLGGKVVEALGLEPVHQQARLAGGRQEVGETARQVLVLEPQQLQRQGVGVGKAVSEPGGVTQLLHGGAGALDVHDPSLPPQRGPVQRVY